MQSEPRRPLSKRRTSVAVHLDSGLRCLLSDEEFSFEERGSGAEMV